MKVYRADAAGKATGDPVATSGNGATSGVLGYEEAAVLDPVGSYVVRVINYAGVEPWTGKVTFEGPPPARPLSRRPRRSSASSPRAWSARPARCTWPGAQKRTFDLRADCKVRR